MLGYEVKNCLLSLLNCGGGGANRLRQARRAVHIRHELIHARQLLLRGMDHNIDALAEDVQVRVRDQRRHLHNDVMIWVKTRHFEINPHQTVMF